MASLGTHIPAEITEYKEKIIGNLTLRQLAAGSVALLCGGLTFLLCHFALGLNSQQCSYAIMAAAALPGAVGFLRPQNMDFEQYVSMRYRHWLRSKPIPYKTTTRGDVKHDSSLYQAKKGEREFTCPYYRYDRRRERLNCKQARKSIRKARKEIRRAKRRWKKAERKK